MRERPSIGNRREITSHHVNHLPVRAVAKPSSKHPSVQIRTVLSQIRDRWCVNSPLHLNSRWGRPRRRWQGAETRRTLWNSAYTGRDLLRTLQKQRRLQSPWRWRPSDINRYRQRPCAWPLWWIPFNSVRAATSLKCNAACAGARVAVVVASAEATAAVAISAEAQASARPSSVVSSSVKRLPVSAVASVVVPVAETAMNVGATTGTTLTALGITRSSRSGAVVASATHRLVDQSGSILKTVLTQ